MKKYKDTINFFKNIKDLDWNIFVNKKWKVKDVLAHLVGWEREVTKELLNVFEKERKAWFVLTDDYSKFNNEIYKEFKNYSPKNLLTEYIKWEDILSKNIKKMGEEKIRKRKDMTWVFDEGENSHFEYHIKQVKDAFKINKYKK